MFAVAIDLNDLTNEPQKEFELRTLSGRLSCANLFLFRDLGC